MTVKELKELVNNIPEECDGQILFAHRDDEHCLYPYYLVEAVDYTANSRRYQNTPDCDPNQSYFYIDIC